MIDIFRKSTDFPRPYVKFRKRKIIIDKHNKAETPSIEEFFIAVDGSHNQVQAIMNFEMSGCQVIDAANLTTNNHKEIGRYLNSRINQASLPEPASLLDERIANAKLKKTA